MGRSAASCVRTRGKDTYRSVHTLSPTDVTFDFEADQCQSLPIDYLPGHVGAVRSQVINADCELDIDEIVQNLNNCQRDVLFDEENQEPEMHVTHFRDINETRRSTTKFERINDSTLDTDTDTNE